VGQLPAGVSLSSGGTIPVFVLQVWQTTEEEKSVCYCERLKQKLRNSGLNMKRHERMLA